MRKTKTPRQKIRVNNRWLLKRLIVFGAANTYGLKMTDEEYELLKSSIKPRKKKTDRQKQIVRMDDMCSEIIRLRALSRVSGCEYCGKPKTIKQLQCSHFIGRGNFHTRWDLDNLGGIDSHCHMDLDENPEIHEAWMAKHIGSKSLDNLVTRSRSTDKVDLDKIEAFLKESLERWRLEG